MYTPQQKRNNAKSDTTKGSKFSCALHTPIPPTPTPPFYPTLFHLFFETSFRTAVATIVGLKSTNHVKCVEALMDAGS